MTDYSALKTLAEARNLAGWISMDSVSIRTILAMIAENEACASRLHEVSTTCATAEQERDRLKADMGEWMNLAERRAQRIIELSDAENSMLDEIQALRKAINSIDDSLYREYWSEYAGLEGTREILDAAMSKDPKD